MSSSFATFAKPCPHPRPAPGPELLPTIFLNDTTSGLTDGLTLRHTGGRIR